MLKRWLRRRPQKGSTADPTVVPASDVRPPLSRLNLALQGGGAHGAFTWGVLERLAEDPRVLFEGLSGSSAGALNAVVFADGWMRRGRDGALQGMAEFWTEVGKQMPSGMVTHGEGNAMSLSRAGKMLVNWAGHFSPPQLNPLDLNPLRDLLNRQVDFEQLRARSPFKLFVGTTHANTGKLRVFRESDLTVDVLLASACLPMIHRSIEIDGEVYWDGGYSANPAIFPLFYDCDSRDVLLVLLSPLARQGTPRSVEEIEERIVELTFSANFMREMRMFAHAIQFSSASTLLQGRLERRLHQMRFHMIDSSEIENLQRTETKLLAYGPFLELLRKQGRDQATAWLAKFSDCIGRQSTIDVKKWFV
jgi:NTE family protein